MFVTHDHKVVLISIYVSESKGVAIERQNSGVDKVWKVQRLLTL